MPQKSTGHCLFAGDYEYFMVGDDLHRAAVSRTLSDGVRQSAVFAQLTAEAKELVLGY